MSRLYYVRAVALPVTATADFFQLRNGSGIRCNVKEIRVWQENLVALELNTILYNRGSGGTGGASASIRKMDTTIANSNCTALTGLTPFTASVGTIDLDMAVDWNVLQGSVWLPTPDFELVIGPSDHLGLSFRVAPSASQTTGVSIFWEESGA